MPGARGLVADMHLVVAAGGGERDCAAGRGHRDGTRRPAARRGRAAAERTAGQRAAADPVPGPALQPAGRQHLHRAWRHRLLPHLHGRGIAAADAVRSPRRGSAEGRGDMALVGGAYVAGTLGHADAVRPLGRAVARRVAAAGRARRAGRRHGDRQRRRLPGAGDREPCPRPRRDSGSPRSARSLSGASRRRAADTARAGALASARTLLPALKPGYAVFSGASGVAAATAEEAGFLADLRDAGPAQGPVRQTTDLLGHTVEAAFPANLALAALAVEAGAAPQALVTGFGIWRGEAMALVEPIPEGAPA